MSFPLSRLPAALLLAVAFASPAWSAAAAQENVVSDAADPGELDPASPLEPLPDLGVDWPDLSAPEPIPETVADGTEPTEPVVEPVQTSDATTERRYRVVLEGLDAIDQDGFRERFRTLSTLVQGEDDSANTAQIDRRAREDQSLLRELVRAYGYYDANVTTRIEPSGNGPLTIALTVAPGPLYRFSSISLPGIEAAGDREAALLAAYGVKVDDAINAEVVTAAEARLKSELGHQGFAFAKVGESETVIDHEARKGAMTLPVDPGRAVNFGGFEIRGRQLFGAKHLGRIARFDPGDRYDSLLIEDLRRALIATGLVSTVALEPVPTADPDVVDIAVTLERAPPRTIAGELGYGTGEGFRAEISWQHRNLIKPEGAVTFRGVAGTQEQLLGATLRRNNFKGRDRVLTAQAVASHTERDAYEATTFTLGAGLERQTNIIWQKKWTWSVGTELVASDERDTIVLTGAERRRTFLIGALPASLAYDGSDDLLNPMKGYRLSGRISPEISFQGSAFGYVRAQIDASTYVPVNEKLVVAGRTRFGSILGASRDRIAPSRRFYAGGGGSVRGYGYQDIGPIDLNGDPIGGRSLAEFSLEARVRLGNFGIVPFVDAGNLYTSTVPKMSGLRFGAGVGARYYTNFGPIRVDVGTPINRRKGDPMVAVYVSLGQAF